MSAHETACTVCGFTAEPCLGWDGDTCPACQDERGECDRLAEAFGFELRLQSTACDPDAPLSFAIWGWRPGESEGDAEIVGAGDTSAEAIADARAQLEFWARNAGELA